MYQDPPVQKLILPICLFVAGTALGYMLHSPSVNMGGGASKGAMEATIKNYLEEHPEVVMDSLRKFQTKQRADNTQHATEQLKEHGGEILKDTNAPVAGNPNGDVTVVEFFDYHCGYCKHMVPTLTQLMKDDPKVKIVFKEFPILSPDSTQAARASLAFSRLKPEKYFAYYSALMNSTGKFDDDMLMAEAKKLGVDPEKLKKEMKSAWVDDELKKNRELAQTLEIRGTPGFVIGQTLIPGAATVDDMKKAIKDTREGKKGDNS